MSKLYESHMSVFLSKRKNDQFREGSVVHIMCGESVECPVRLVERLIVRAHSSGASPLFQSFSIGKPALELTGKCITYEQLRGRVLKGLAGVMDRDEKSVAKEFGLHSLRTRGATTVAASMVDERLFQAHGGCKTKGTMHAYIAESLTSMLGVSALLGC